MSCGKTAIYRHMWAGKERGMRDCTPSRRSKTGSSREEFQQLRPVWMKQDIVSASAPYMIYGGSVKFSEASRSIAMRSVAK